MAEPSFDRNAFAAGLATRRLGRELIVLAETGSTNDAVWEAWEAGAGHGLAVVADEQTRGRGRLGRAWHTGRGKGLAISVLLGEVAGPPRAGEDRGGTRMGLATTGALPLAIGLGLANALERLGARAELKWPNDLLLAGRKVAGILCESRGPSGDRPAAVVVGVGVNVLQRREDFPAALGAAADPTPPATSLWIEGHRSTRETVAAGFLNALEPLLELLESRGAAPVLEAWQARAGFWGQRLRVRTPAGALEGIARRLDPGGGLVLALDGGGETVVTAGDLEAAETSAREER